MTAETVDMPATINVAHAAHRDWGCGYPHGPSALDIQALGDPIGQGNIRHLGKGRPAVHQNAKLLLPWRDAITYLAHNGLTRSPVPVPLLGPVGVWLTFTMPKPKAAPKRRRTYPITRPDIDHLERAVLDALKKAGAYKDDSQVIDVHKQKAYPGEHYRALNVPGVAIEVFAIEEGL